MSDIETVQDPAPFLVTAGVVIDVAGNATVTGATTLFTKKFAMKKASLLSFAAQGSGSGAGMSWKIFAANDYEVRPGLIVPGTFKDISALFGAAGVISPPATKQFAATFTNAGDFFSSWAFPFAHVQFQMVQTSGSEIVTAQFFSGGEG